MKAELGLYDYIAAHPVVYVTRSLERALGLTLGTPGYYIVTNSFPGEQAYIEQSHGRLLTIQSDRMLDTDELLEHPEASVFIKKISKVSLAVFKNTPKIERAAKKLGLPLLNPGASLNAKVEDKISQIAWLQDLASFLPPHSVKILHEVVFAGVPLIVQFNHAHSGEGTLLIQSERELRDLTDKFPNREVRVTDYIRGPVFTSNNVVTASGVLYGNVSYQITGLAPFTDKPFATIGNDWGLPKRYLSKEHRTRLEEFAEAIGKKLFKDGFRGLFGIDVILESQTNKLYLLEINARQPASVSFESVLQKQAEPGLFSIFEAHLAALLGLPVATLSEIRNGAQILQRVTAEWLAIKPSFNLEKFKARGFTAFAYKNIEPNAEVLRIQSKESIMESHNRFNEKGREIVSLLPVMALTERTLHEAALDVVLSYLNLPIGSGVACPYFNNRKTKLRGALRAHIGKGSPTEIVDEIRIASKKSGLALQDLNEKETKKFLVDHHFGIDCSGLVYHTLDAESKARGAGPLKAHLRFPNATNVIRKALVKIRPVENTNVAVFADPENSTAISLREVLPGDFVVMENSGMTLNDERDHMVLIIKVESDDSGPKRLTYLHSIAWPEDGTYGHGVREGTIEIADLDKPIQEERWIERGKIGEENYTWKKAVRASNISLRRLKWL